jgi:hypothetical protein
MKTDRPNQEETTDIDNQDPLKAWILFLTEKKIMQGKIIRQKQSEIGLLANKTQTEFQKTPLRMCDSDREEEDYL